MRAANRNLHTARRTVCAREDELLAKISVLTVVCVYKVHLNAQAVWGHAWRRVARVVSHRPWVLGFGASAMNVNNGIVISGQHQSLHSRVGEVAEVDGFLSHLTVVHCTRKQADHLAGKRAPATE